MPIKQKEVGYNTNKNDDDIISLATADTSLAYTIDTAGENISHTYSTTTTTTFSSRNSGNINSRSTEFTILSGREGEERSNPITSFSKRDNHLTTSGEFALSSSKAIATRERIHNCSLFNIRPSQTQNGTSSPASVSSSLSLYGREKETLLLKDCLERVAGYVTKLEETDVGCIQHHQQQQEGELILISGLSGTGKTTLASTLKDLCAKKYRGLFLTGKYDQNILDDPLSAIASVCCQLCWEIGSLRTTDATGSCERKNENGVVTFTSIREAIIQQIDETELRLLTNFVPDLKGIVGANAKSTNNGGHMTSDCFGDHQGSIEARDRLLFAFRKFFQCMVHFFAPIVVVLDDLQWSDCSSMELIKSLVTEQQQSIPGLLLIGCYRSNEVDDTHYLSKTIRDIKNNTATKQILTEISLENLNIESVQGLVMDVLYMSDESQCKSLVQFCFDRTHGNIFFLLNFLSMLENEELIRYNVGTQSWSWDIDELEQKTAATQNVVDLVMGQMANTSEETKALLRLAACLGNEFRKETLFLIWSKYMNNKDMGPSTFNQMLDDLIDGRFLERAGSSSSYRFIHDKIQEAAMALGDYEENFSSLQYNVGTILHKNLDEQQLEEYMFVVANLQSNATEKSSMIADLNLKAAKKAQTLSAIDSVTKFVSKGVAFLPTGSWKDHPELSLELHSLGAESEVSLGNFDQAEKYCMHVLKQENLPMVDTARIYMVQISIRQGLGKVKDALNLAFDVLNILGCKIPRNSMSTTVTIIRSMWKLRSPPTNERVAALPSMSDPVKRKIMHVLDIAGLLAHHAGDGQSAMLMRAYQVKWTLKYGICDQSPSAFAAYAVTCWALGDFPALLKYNEIALTLLDKTPVNFYDPAALLISCNYGLGWVKPIQSIAKKSMEGYKIGMQVGNTMMAMYCVFNYIHCSFVGGGPLKTLEEDCAIYSPQMLGLKRFECNDWLILLWQSAQNLMGLSDNTTVLSGEIMNEIGYREKQGSGSNPVGMILLRYCKVTLCTYFGDYETGAKLSLAKGDEYLTDLPANSIGAFDSFVRGVCLYAMARKSKKSKYRRRANQVRSKLRKWVAKGNPNSAHQSKLLDAEHKVLIGNTASARKLYHDATVLAARGGFLHDCALANERYAVTLLELEDTEAGRDRLERAIRFYTTWGATAKVESLKEAHSKVLS